MKFKVNFKIPQLTIFFNSDKKFVFVDQNRVGKIPHKSTFGISTQIIPNWMILDEKNQ